MYSLREHILPPPHKINEKKKINKKELQQMFLLSNTLYGLADAQPGRCSAPHKDVVPNHKNIKVIVFISEIRKAESFKTKK